jgi:hypothetical protein
LIRKEDSRVRCCFDSSVSSPSNGLGFSVTTRVPSYLRVHHGDDLDRGCPNRRSSADQFWAAFSNATGWRVDRRHNKQPIGMLPAVEGDLMAGEPSATQPPVVRENAAELAELAVEMTEELRELQSTIRRQEIELAAHAAAQVGISSVGRLADSVEQTLRWAISACGFDSAAIYMLDDATEFLRTRAVVGLPADRLQAEPRPLRGSRGDLEAMVQQAVLMDDLRGPMASTWSAPESAGAAICTALLRGDLPVGTMWLFRDQPKTLDQSHAAIAQLASSQIALELSAAAMRRSESKGRQASTAVNDVAAWQFAALPIGAPIARGWNVDGMIESSLDWAIGWHHWDILPDGSLMIAMAEAEERSSRGAMIAATGRAALVAHSGYRHSPPEILHRISDTLWQTNTEQQLLSLLYARLDPETGEGELASAGRLSAIIGGKHGHRPLVAGGNQPLASALDVECFQSTFQLHAGETLLGYGPGLAEDGISQDLLGCCLKSAIQSRLEPLTVLRRELADFPSRNERGMLTLRRD